MTVVTCKKSWVETETAKEGNCVDRFKLGSIDEKIEVQELESAVAFPSPDHIFVASPDNALFDGHAFLARPDCGFVMVVYLANVAKFRRKSTDLGFLL